ncbi:hypothetical protein K440DRAFT_666818 [Wilcoxina mikolae CBS 423.85]|nr:hypothetical protein K440DRAFT_666818 [Wilcoxina mikolae CBS 423.85]
MSFCTNPDCVFRVLLAQTFPRSLDDRSDAEIDHILQHFGWPPSPTTQLSTPLTPPHPPHQQLSPITPPTLIYTYTPSFTPSGDPTSGLTKSHFNTFILPNSRGVFLKNIPMWTRVSDIIPQIRGGRVERVDFQNHQNRTCVGVFFVLAEHAERYIKDLRRSGGVYWRDVGIISPVEAIPRAKGGHEPIKPNIAKAIRGEDATRILIVSHLPPGTREDVLMEQIRKQTSNLTVEFEDVSICEGSRTAVIKMSSIGTALGARLRLQRAKWYEGCTFAWGVDECEGSLDELRGRWEREMRWDAERRRLQAGAGV